MLKDDMVPFSGVILAGLSWVLSNRPWDDLLVLPCSWWTGVCKCILF